MRALFPALLSVLVLAPAIAQAGGGVYQWKDAKGVTHYADTPPPASEYKQRSINHPDPDQPATAAKPAENPACATARQNIALLNGHQNVQIDSDGDGKPDKALSADDRANQLALAQATLKTSCASGQ
jgi:hypothetical protein